MASRIRRCKSRVSAEAAAAILNNWDSSSSEYSDSDLDSDFDVGRGNCSTSGVTTRPKRFAGAGSNQKNAKKMKKTSAGNATSSNTTNTNVHSDDVDSDNASSSHGNINNNAANINNILGNCSKKPSKQSPTFSKTNSSHYL